MDAHNRFETRTTFLLGRLEWAAALAVSVGLAVAHLDEIRWAVFVPLFLVIDVVGYLPGAVAYRRRQRAAAGGGPGPGRLHRGYYVAYNLMHSLVTGAVLVGLWAWLVGPEWALLAVPIHLFGDRALFGNTLKPFGVTFEPVTHPAFAAFERRYGGEARPVPVAPAQGREAADAVGR